MSRELEILIPAGAANGDLSRTVASLTSQTDRNFAVLLGDNFSTSSRTGVNPLDAAKKNLEAAGIDVRRVKPPGELQRLEHWNWLHAQAQGEWIKLLLPGEQLKPAYVRQLTQRIKTRPQAQLIRCDLELQTEWGPETSAASFTDTSIRPAEFGNFFPAHADWMAYSANIAYGRTAWLSMGGYSAQLPAFTALNLNVILALHHGLENIPEVLAARELPGPVYLNKNLRQRVNHSLELWAILRQAKNYCSSAKLPWPHRWLLPAALTAAQARW